jgi:methionyl-tRNA formyltransferase
MTSANRYLVAGAKSWNREVFDQTISKYSGAWKFISSRDELSADLLAAFDPRYVFFLHWSWKVPADIVDKYECVCFHMTDVPYGRGGSPLQNLILRGHRQTKLTALRMVEDFDAGPVYLKESLSLEGTAEEIYRRASDLSAQMIQRIISEQPKPRPQEGEATVFRRRKPAESQIPSLPSLESLYDFIRMMDAEGYPHVYLDHEGFRYEFSEAALDSDSLVARVRISALEENK